VADLQKQFPRLKDGNAVWKPAVARVKTAHDHQLLSFVATNQKLDGLLNSELSLRELSQRKISAAERTDLIRLKFELLLLTARANPILRPTVQDYGNFTAALLAGKRRGLVRRLSEMETLRERIVSRMSEIDDYMNWLEATKLTSQSGLFATEAGGQEPVEASAPHRRDPISIYLDALEDQF
jgi:hypothetical protein